MERSFLSLIFFLPSYLGLGSSSLITQTMLACVCSSAEFVLLLTIHLVAFVVFVVLVLISSRKIEHC
jgi:hypothetical protein